MHTWFFVVRHFTVYKNYLILIISVCFLFIMRSAITKLNDQILEMFEL